MVGKDERGWRQVVHVGWPSGHAMAMAWACLGHAEQGAGLAKHGNASGGAEELWMSKYDQG